jgi:hypothetical protein
MEKIPVMKSTRSGTKRKIKHVRKATNEEIMFGALKRWGCITTRVSFQVYGADDAVYGLRGKSFSFKVTSVRDVEKTLGAMVKLIQSFQQ